MGERVGIDGGEDVGVDRRHDDCRGGAPVPPGERGRDPLLLLLPWPPPGWEEGFPSGPWPLWRWSGRSPSEIGSLSLFSSVSHFFFLALHRFLNIRRSITPIALKF